jgi:hypothetical protein
MTRIALLSLFLGLFLGSGLFAPGIDSGRAQDIPGIEDCTKTTGLDKRTGCLQSNVNFLQRLVSRNALEVGQQLKAAEAEIVALKTSVTTLQKAVEQLQSKPPGDKKPAAK